VKIVYRGDAFSPTGYSQAIRNYIRALLQLGHEVWIDHIGHGQHQFNPANFDFMRRAKLVPKENPKAGYIGADIVIDQETPEFYQRRKDILQKGAKKDVKHIAFCVWETSKLPRQPFDWVKALNEMDAIFVPSKFCKEVFEKSGINKKIYVVPHIIDTEKFKPGKAVKIADIDDGKFVFLSVFQWLERKNPQALLMAYLTGFTKDDPVHLVLKCHGISFSMREKERILQEIDKTFLSLNLGISKQESAPVELCFEPLDEDEMPLLYRACHSIVLPSCGEGFCLPVAEAMASGCVPIVTGWSSLAELVEDGTGFRVDYVLEPATKVYGSPWYSAYQNWAKVKILYLRKAMRKVFTLWKKKREEFMQISERARESIIKRYSLDAVCHILNHALEEVEKLK